MPMWFRYVLSFWRAVVCVCAAAPAASESSAKIAARFRISSASIANERATEPYSVVKIVAGEFVMGCMEGDRDFLEDEVPAPRVRLTNSFEIGRYDSPRRRHIRVPRALAWVTTRGSPITPTINRIRWA